MYTRTETIVHAYAPLPVVPRTQMNGAVRITVHKGIVQTWAISRPTSSFIPAGAPFYLSGMDKPSGVLMSSGSQPLKLPPQRIAADLSDQSTWKRNYSVR